MDSTAARELPTQASQPDQTTNFQLSGLISKVLSQSQGDAGQVDVPCHVDTELKSFMQKLKTADEMKSIDQSVIPQIQWLHSLVTLKEDAQSTLISAAELVAEYQVAFSRDLSAFTAATDITSRMKKHIAADNGIKYEYKHLEEILAAFETDLAKAEHADKVTGLESSDLDTADRQEQTIQANLKEFIKDAQSISAKLAALEENESLFTQLQPVFDSLSTSFADEIEKSKNEFDALNLETAKHKIAVETSEFRIHRQILLLIESQKKEIASIHDATKSRVDYIRTLIANHASQLKTLYERDIQPLYAATCSAIIQSIAKPEEKLDDTRKEVKTASTVQIKQIFDQAREMRAWAESNPPLKATLAPRLDQIAKQLKFAHARVDDLKLEQPSMPYTIPWGAGSIVAGAGSIKLLVLSISAIAAASAVTAGSAAILVAGLACAYLAYLCMKRMIYLVKKENDLLAGNKSRPVKKRLVDQDNRLRAAAESEAATLRSRGEPADSIKARQRFVREGILLRSHNEDFFKKMEHPLPADKDEDPCLSMRKDDTDQSVNKDYSQVQFVYKRKTQTFLFKPTPEHKDGDEMSIHDTEKFKRALKSRAGV